MTPKEKAIELYNSCREEFPVLASNIRAKKCALITIEEVLNAISITTGHLDLSRLGWQEVQMDIDYWKQVKSEIENL